MQLRRLGAMPFDGDDFGAVGLHREHDAGAHGLAVEEDRAGAADAVLAADMGAGEAQDRREGNRPERARLAAPLTRLAVDGQTDVHQTRHVALIAVSIAPPPGARRARSAPASTAADSPRMHCRSASGSTIASRRLGGTRRWRRRQVHVARELARPRAIARNAMRCRRSRCGALAQRSPSRRITTVTAAMAKSPCRRANSSTA